MWKLQKNPGESSRSSSLNSTFFCGPPHQRRSHRRPDPRSLSPANRVTVDSHMFSWGEDDEPLTFGFLFSRSSDPPISWHLPRRHPQRSRPRPATLRPQVPRHSPTSTRPRSDIASDRAPVARQVALPALRLASARRRPGAWTLLYPLSLSLVTALPSTRDPI